jgi:tripartite-type tricarboxylate transporter receptor subunit TctC
MARDPQGVVEKLVPVAIVNKPGGGGAAGIGYVAASRKADPHTLILINGSTQITPILNPQAKTLTEVTPVINMMLDDFLLFVRADAPWKSAAEFVKDAKSKPAKSVAFSTGVTTDVMAITVLSKATGVEYNTVASTAAARRSRRCSAGTCRPPWATRSSLWGSCRRARCARSAWCATSASRA